MRIKAFTVVEMITTVIILGIIAVILIVNMRPNQIKKETLIKAGKASYIQVDYATAQLIAKNTKNYTLARVVGDSGEFSIASSSNTAALINVYKKRLRGLRSKTLGNVYKNADLKNEAGSVVESGLSVSDFTGFTTKDAGYFGVRLHGNCTTSEAYLYNPVRPTLRTQSNSCGQIFFDVNGEQEPNTLGIDQYLVSLTLNGVR